MKVVCINNFRPASFIPQTVAKITTSRKEVGDSVFNMIRYRGHSIRSCARTWGLTDVETFALYLEGDARHEEKVAKMAYRAGKLSVMPPPPMAMRVAA